MSRRVKKVAVLGAGVMGSGIAAHLANAGVPVLLLDIVPPFLKEEEKKIPAKRNLFAAGAMKNAPKAKPISALYKASSADLVEVGNFEDDLHKVASCDWIIEVVKEDLAIKQALFAKLDELTGPDTIITSNTSGLAIKDMVAGRTEKFRRNFFVTHFFNPVRVMKLLELVVGTDTDPAAVSMIAEFGEKYLGKGIVYGKDTPNFIGNRLGIHGMMVAIQEMMAMGLTVEDVDAVAGVPMGRPRSAAFKTVDLVGLDTFASVSNTVYNGCPDDEEREVFKVPPFVGAMIKNGWLGNKAKGGFYKKSKDASGKSLKQAMDWQKVEYREQQRPEWESVKAVKGIEDTGPRIRKLLEGTDTLAAFAWKVTARSLIYAITRLGEIADDVVNMDRAMKWGYNWELGPFEVWDAIGVKASVQRMKADGFAVPAKLDALFEKGDGTFYREKNGVLEHFDFAAGKYRPVPVGATWMTLGALRKAGSVVSTNDSATLHDLGDGVLGLEFHSKMNSVDDNVIRMMWEGLDKLEAPQWKGMVIYNEGANFSVGANLLLINMYANQKKFAEIEMIVDHFQRVNTALHRAPKPVIAAPHQMALGGGCEICLGASHILAHAEWYVGLVEVGVGLIPGGGGCKEMLIRWLDQIPPGVDVSPLKYVQKAFEFIGMAKVALGAGEAEEMRILRPGRDRFVTSRDNQLHNAKMLALGLHAGGYTPDAPRIIEAVGRDGIANINVGLYSFGLSGWVTEWDT
ncbi:MAG: 3-hydroxyacyl-CoA dehydrogenase/enoyl-CoA hydratase family protein, partial [Deltaproteobacteria bacterium]|nr:3-hydroxyacyl-CoA dehydrogenase/enoyl-CoA hydratase family protein [Deltaproteobacteria bacterium]